MRDQAVAIEPVMSNTFNALDSTILAAVKNDVHGRALKARLQKSEPTEFANSRL